MATKNFNFWCVGPVTENEQTDPQDIVHQEARGAQWCSSNRV